MPEIQRLRRLTADDAARFLRDHLGGDIHYLAPIGQGEWSQDFAFTHNADDFVARFGACLIRGEA